MKYTRKIVIWFAGAALMAALWVAASFLAISQLREAIAVHSDTFHLLSSTNEVLSDLCDAETGQRGYLLTGDKAFLEPYLTVHRGVRGKLQSLHDPAVPAAIHQHLDALTPLVDAKLKELERVVELRDSQGFAAAQTAVANAQGKRLMDAIRAEIQDIVQIGETALALRQGELQSNMRRMSGIVAVAGLFTLLFAFLAVHSISRKRFELALQAELAERHRAETALHETNTQLAGALASVKSLSGLLPICAGCKKIRDDQGYWSQVESYVQQHSEATFTHSMCPECTKKWYPELDDAAPVEQPGAASPQP